ncbi:hypothetical protein QL285_032122 [Trifolium repens]|nr:hypothetical protein QL285_032122 [Trifolium repens]
MLKETLIYDALPRKQLLRLKKKDAMIKWTSSASRDRADHYKIIRIIFSTATGTKGSPYLKDQGKYPSKIPAQQKAMITAKRSKSNGNWDLVSCH